MKSHVAPLSVLVIFIFSTVNAQIVCHSGKRATALATGSVSADTYMGAICAANQTCESTVFYSDAGTTGVVMTQTGGCFLSGGNITCPYLANQYNVTGHHNCTHTECSTFACNSPAVPSGCPGQVAQNDIQVLPMCTVRESYSKVIACVDTLLTGYPYQGTQQCLTNIDAAMACGIREIETCLTGYCPTILDSLPVALRPIYQEVVRISANFTSLNALFDGVQLTNATIRNDIINTACLQSNSPYLQNVTQLLGSLNVNLTFENPVCDNQVIMDLYDAGVAEIPNILNAQTHAELCTPINKLQTMTVNMWQTRCNKTAVIELLRPIIPSYYSSLFPEIEKGIDIAVDLMTTFVFPGCGSTTQDPSASTVGSSSSVAVTQGPGASTTSGVAGLKHKFLQQSLYLVAIAGLTAAAL